jgi:hypothetical protein
MRAVAIDTAPPRAAAVTLGERHWRVAAIALLSARFIQGFIYWGGGSRRIIYGPEKLNPDAPIWMANKFQSAMCHLADCRAAAALRQQERRSPGIRLLRENAPKSGSQRTRRWRGMDSNRRCPAKKQL